MGEPIGWADAVSVSIGELEATEARRLAADAAPSPPDDEPVAVPWHRHPPADGLLADAELYFFPAYTQPYHDPEQLAHARFRRVVGDALAAAEARGRQWAIDTLRRVEIGGGLLVTPTILADFLEAMATEEATRDG
jgi:hypothetical protein